VDADLDALATALYVRIDDTLADCPELRPWRPKVGISPKLSDAELLTLAALQVLLGFEQERVRRRGSHHPAPQHRLGGPGAQHVGVIDVRPARHHRRDQRAEIAAGDAPPTRPTSRSRMLISASGLRRAINVAGTSSAAFATRFGSSKTSSIRPIPRATPLAETASPTGDDDGGRHRHRPSPGRLFRGHATPRTPTSSVDRG
jgi:hypothetical protein